MTTTKWNKIDRKQITSNYTHSWRLNSSLLNDEWVKEEIKKGWNISWNQMKMKTQNNRTFVTHWKQSQKGNYNSAYVHLKSIEIYKSSLNEKFPSGMTMFLLRVKDYLPKTPTAGMRSPLFRCQGCLSVSQNTVIAIAFVNPSPEAEVKTLLLKDTMHLRRMSQRPLSWDWYESLLSED